MKSKEEKNGQTHIEVVISFVIFVTFLMFLYILLILPYQTQNNKQSLVNYVRDEITGNYMNSFNTSSIYIFGSRKKSCISDSGSNEPLINLPSSNNLMIKNDSGGVIGYYISNGNKIILQVDSSYMGILKIYYGSNINPSPAYSSSPCDNVALTINSTKTENITSQYNLVQLINNYISNYASLKNSLGVPNDSDFWISFNQSNGTVISPPSPNIPSLNVYSNQIPIEYIDNNATEQIGIVTLELW